VIDQIWDNYDVDGSGALDYEETRLFLKKTFARLNMAQDFTEEAFKMTF
jgi:Ca2+-binding EF-hand superfamily protein